MQRGHPTRGIRFLAVAFTIGIITTLASYATDVFTDPVGFITLSIQGTNGLSVTTANTFLGLGLTQVPALRGAISSFITNALVTGSTLTPGQYAFTSDGNPAYFVEVLDGANPGLLDDITGNSATTLYTSTNNAANIGGATLFKVYPHWTIGTVFGPQNQVGLKATTSANTADNVLVFNPLTQTYIQYYYSSGGLAGTGWRKYGTTPANLTQTNVVLYIDQGILIAKHSSLSTNFLLCGGVKLGQTKIPIYAGNNFAPNVYAGTNNLGNSNLHNAGGASVSLVGTTSANTADNVLVFDPVGQTYVQYYWSTGGLAGVGWRKYGTTPANLDQSGVALPVGRAQLIVRRTANGAMTWTPPMPYTP